MEILEYIKRIVERNSWERYLEVRNVSQDALWKTQLPDEPDDSKIPYDEPEAAKKYHLRRSFERKFKTEIERSVREELCSLRAIDEDTGVSEEIHLHTLSNAHIRFDTGEIDMGSRLLKFIEVTVKSPARAVAGNELPYDQQRKKVEEQVREWLKGRQDRGEAPLSQKKTYTLASQDIPSRYLNEHLFRGIWNDLGHPHPLKFGGRPSREDR